MAYAIRGRRGRKGERELPPSDCTETARNFAAKAASGRHERIGEISTFPYPIAQQDGDRNAKRKLIKKKKVLIKKKKVIDKKCAHEYNDKALLKKTIL